MEGEEKLVVWQSGRATNLLLFVFAFMFLYLAISYLGAPVELAALVSVGLVGIIYGFKELNWGKYVSKVLKKQEERQNEPKRDNETVQ